jgi:hypothetical protein
MSRKSDVRALIVVAIVLVAGLLLGSLRRADATLPAAAPGTPAAAAVDAGPGDRERPHD